MTDTGYKRTVPLCGWLTKQPEKSGAAKERFFIACEFLLYCDVVWSMEHGAWSKQPPHSGTGHPALSTLPWPWAAHTRANQKWWHRAPPLPHPTVMQWACVNFPAILRHCPPPPLPRPTTTLGSTGGAARDSLLQKAQRDRAAETLHREDCYLRRHGDPVHRPVEIPPTPLSNRQSAREH